MPGLEIVQHSPSEISCFMQLRQPGFTLSSSMHARPDDSDCLLLQIIPVEASRLRLAGTFKAPVYVTQSRRNAMGVGLVFEADLATDMHPSHWVLQGVALVLNIDR